MTTRHVLDQLPLWIGEDLPEAASLRVTEHLDACLACRDVAEALRESQAWLKDAPPLPFDEADFTAIRQSVRAQLEREAVAASKPKVLWPFYGNSVLATAAALLLVVMAAHRGFQTERPANASVGAAPPGSVPPPTSPPLKPSAAVAEIVPDAPSPVRPRIPTIPLTTASNATHVEVPPLQIRIDLQTPNPNIRIIWLPNSSEPSSPS